MAQHGQADMITDSFYQLLRFDKSINHRARDQFDNLWTPLLEARNAERLAQSALASLAELDALAVVVVFPAQPTKPRTRRTAFQLEFTRLHARIIRRASATAKWPIIRSS